MGSGRQRILAVALAAAVGTASAVALEADAPADTSRRLTAQEICDAKPVLVSCSAIDSLEPARRAALEEDALSTLHGRSPRQAVAEARADLEKPRREHPIKLVGDAGKRGGARPGEITRYLKLSNGSFRSVNAWIAPDRLVGGHKNSITIYVGSAPKDVTRGLLVRSAEGDTVPEPNDYALTPVPLPGDHGRGAHIVRVNTRGIVTIGFSDGSTLEYDAIHARFP